jgi:chaperonin GroEL
MQNTQLYYSNEAREKIQAGVDKIADAVKVTLGPKGRNVIYMKARPDKPHLPSVTKDGVTVAKSITRLQDPLMDYGAQMVKEVALTTAYEAGDGTTTATILAQSIISGGAKAMANGANPTDVKKGIDMGVVAVVEHLKANARAIESNSAAALAIATISANNDAAIGAVVAEAIAKAGNDGLITIENSPNPPQTFTKAVEGMQIDKGYINNHFVNVESRQTCEFSNPYILIFDRKVSEFKDIERPLSLVFTEKVKRPLLIIADDIDGEALSTLVINKVRQGHQICAVRAPGIGETKSEIIKDLCIVTGATLISDALGTQIKNISLDQMGTAEKIVITNTSTSIYGGNGKKVDISDRCDTIRLQLSKTTDVYQKPALEKRLARLSNGVAILYVGATTDVELAEKKDRVDDALRATRCAIEEGVVPGGGVAYIRSLQVLSTLAVENADQLIGVEILHEALQEPFLQIQRNAGVGEPTALLHEIANSEGYDTGVNAKTGETESFIETGVIDPVKVSRIALENAASIGGTLLLTECAVVTIQD